MRTEFIPYEQALELKEILFNEPCLAKYNTLDLVFKGCYEDSALVHVLIEESEICEAHILAPTFSQAFRWFREKYGLNYEITYAGKKGEYNAFVNDYIYGNNKTSPSVFSYEEAEFACLEKLIELVKQK